MGDIFKSLDLKYNLSTKVDDHNLNDSIEERDKERDTDKKFDHFKKLSKMSLMESHRLTVIDQQNTDYRQTMTNINTKNKIDND